MKCPLLSYRWLRRIFPVVLGMIGGYAYYAFIGCVSGSCPITSNPWLSTMYGGIIGALFIPTISKTSANKDSKQEETKS